MKTQIRTLTCLVSLSAIVACSQAPSAATSEADQTPPRTTVVKDIVDTTQYSEAYHQKLAEHSQPYLDAIEKYGQEKYHQIANQIFDLERSFIENPNIKTKEALINYYKETKAFAMLMQPVTDAQIAEAQANNEAVLGQYVIEWDVNKIDAYYTDKMAQIADKQNS